MNTVKLSQQTQTEDNCVQVQKDASAKQMRQKKGRSNFFFF